MHAKCFDRSDTEPRLDDVTRLRGDNCPDCDAPCVAFWDDDHGWGGRHCPCDHDEPCFACGWDHATEWCECGNAVCREHWDNRTHGCQLCGGLR